MLLQIAGRNIARSAWSIFGTADSELPVDLFPGNRKCRLIAL